MNEILSEAEIVAFTGKVRHRAQLRVLERRGIRAVPRDPDTRDWFPIVAREHVESWLKVRKTVAVPAERTEPNFAALDS